MEAGGAVIIAVLKDVRVGERFCSPCAGGCGGRAGSGVSAGPSSRSLCWRPSRRWRPGWRREKLRQSRARAPPRPAGVTARQRPVLVQSCWSRSRGSGPRGRVPLTCERCPLPGAPGGSDWEEPACSAGGPGSIPGSGRSPGGGHGDPLQCSCLENPMDRGAWWATVHGVANSQTSHTHTHAHTCVHIPW